MDKKMPQNQDSYSPSTQKAQIAANKFVQYLRDQLHYPQEKILEIVGTLTGVITNLTILAVFREMTSEELDNWKNIVESGANDSQQLLLIDKFLQKKINKSFEELNNEILVKTVNYYKNELKTSKKLVEQINRLNEEQTEQAMSYLNKGQLSMAEEFLNLNIK